MDGAQEKQVYSTEEPRVDSTSGKSVSWTASEYITHEKSQTWYIYFFLGSILITAFIYIILNDVIAAVAIFVASLSAGFFANRPPVSKKYYLSKGSLSVGGKVYNLGDFKSFSVVEEGAINSIWFKPLRRMKPFLIVYFSPKDEKKIAEVLNYYLPNEPRELDTISRLMKRLRF